MTTAKMKAVPTLPAGPTETRSAPEWRDHFYALALTGYGASKRPTLDPAACVAGGRAIGQLLRDNEDLARSVAVKQVDPAFLAGGGLLADDLGGRLDKLPPDLRRIARLTPGDRAAIRDAAADLAILKKAVAAAARSAGDTDAAKAFGIGVVYVRSTADGVGDAIQHFLVGARAYKGLLADAAIGAEEVTALENHGVAMASIDSERGQRDGHRGRTSGELAVLTMALERWFLLYRARVGLALARDAVALAAALGPVPKVAGKRRKKVAAVVAGEVAAGVEPPAG